ncbi:2-succinyl-6-hydroxy-2,4-cyclohexadiene-1-carboxylate synthase [Rhodohalobacter sp. SW132]|uniref:2-succinyl-6-hydroxy-2, 4-cyclohexadiene-1-carboxylate synthase n=1 Tax=Rhodohalobacter sp. SW132 TaxID=2293433 RepID=UPI000E27A297|nr:2-succinyl-6-hydroxy-2,4-cyclohexadiene-1-carboxylate synthase [Rhodohalobacter sp. SW132]REL24092.1 2-succinyl-6-hydroxy-2,4-cyclohexadiene-1-carboxylate synthase [Rhodohalobacter sp. SW132]
MKLYTNGVMYKVNIHQNRADLPYLFFLHGFMGSSKVFEPVISRVRETCNPVTIDLLGHGDTIISDEVNPDRFAAQNQVADLLSVLNRLKLPDLFIYGYSMGGRLAQHLVANHPSYFSGLILESTHCGITDSNERENRAATDENRAQEIEEDFESFVDEWIRLPLFDSQNDESEINYEQIIRQQNPKWMAASLRGFGAGVMSPVCKTLADLNHPKLLIAGKIDQKYVDKMTQMAQLCSNATVEIIEDAGHRVHADRPEQIAKILTQFLNSHV